MQNVIKEKLGSSLKGFLATEFGYLEAHPLECNPIAEALIVLIL